MTVGFFHIKSAHPAADIYCYLCNDAKQDPEIKAHLAAFGINVGSLTKTEKSMTELVRTSPSLHLILR